MIEDKYFDENKQLCRSRFSGVWRSCLAEERRGRGGRESEPDMNRIFDSGLIKLCPKGLSWITPKFWKKQRVGGGRGEGRENPNKPKLDLYPVFLSELTIRNHARGALKAKKNLNFCSKTDVLNFYWKREKKLFFRFFLSSWTKTGLSNKITFSVVTFRSPFRSSGVEK